MNKAQRRRLIVLLAGVGLLVVWVALRLAASAAKPCGRPIRTLCASHLKQIGLACHLYAEDFDGALPPTLGHLYPAFLHDGGLFICPAGGGATPVEDDPAFTPVALGDTHTDYVYVAGLRADDPKDYVLAFDEEWNHGSHRFNVAFVDRRVHWWVGSRRLHKQIEKQRAELAANGRTMRVIRPAWSRWPERPVYPARPWHLRFRKPALAVGALAAVAVALALVVRTARRGRKRRAKGDGADAG